MLGEGERASFQGDHRRVTDSMSTIAFLDVSIESDTSEAGEETRLRHQILGFV